MLWVVFAMMTSVVALALARPLSERREGFGAHDSDVAFYRGLLAEADDDVRCGLVAPEDAVATRAEIGRRLLASLNLPSKGRPRASRRRRAETRCSGLGDRPSAATRRARVVPQGRRSQPPRHADRIEADGWELHPRCRGS